MIEGIERKVCVILKELWVSPGVDNDDGTR